MFGEVFFQRFTFAPTIDPLEQRTRPSVRMAHLW